MEKLISKDKRTYWFCFLCQSYWLYYY